MTWYHGVAERDHAIHDPISADKIRLVGERLRLGPHSHVLDVASGSGGPALVLAEAFGCRVTGVERSDQFFDAACAASRDQGLDRLVEFVHADALEFPFERGAYDVSICLGARFIWGDLARTLEALKPAARPHGHVVVGEPYWRRLPLPPDYPDRDEPFAALAETVERFERAGLPVVSVIAASEDDWDNYVTLTWRAVEEWLAEHADNPDAEEIEQQYRSWKERYLRWQRDLLGWAIFLGWKR